MKLSRLLLVTWTVTLVLFVHNFLPATRVLYDLPGMTRALVYAGVATLLIAIHTLNQERRANKPGRTTPWMAVAGGWVLLTAVMTVWLNVFVISESFSEQIEDLFSSQDDPAPPF